MLADPENDWCPWWSAAELVNSNLRALLQDSERGPEAVAAGEADMVESLSAQIGYTADEAVLVPDPFWASELGRTHGQLVLLDLGADRLHLLVGGDGLGSADPTLTERLNVGVTSPRRRGTWVHLDDSPPRWPTAEQLLAAARAAHPDLLAEARRELARRYREKRADHWVAITFMEEGPERGETRRAWVFIELRLELKKPPHIQRLAEAQPITAQARALRTPELQGLNAARVVIVGAGSLGAPLTLELAKAGIGQITVVDRDYYEASNSVRHVLPVNAAGLQKAPAVARLAQRLNPLISVTAHQRKVGGANAGELLADAELVVDTTGSQAVGRMLSRRCRELGKVLIIAGLSNGAYGGDLAILDPDGACFTCLALGQAAGDVPSPRSGPHSNRTPIGCGHPAFSGSGFDATELAAITARAVVGTGGWCEYPRPAYDWLVVNFRGEDPWQAGRLAPRPGCSLCGAR